MTKRIRSGDVDRGAARAADAHRILRAAIAAADPKPAVHRAVREAPELRDAHRIHLVAIGKAAGVMAGAAIEALRSISSPSPSPSPSDAIAILPHHAAERDACASGLRILHAAHPYPDESSELAAAEVEKVITSAGARDTVLVLISGGASSLCAAPTPGITIDEYAGVVRMLMRAGADIHELNTVRTHIDRLKGGRMARLIAPARALGLIVSDVVGNPLDVIASGPLTPCTSTAGDAIRILKGFGLLSRIPASVRSALEHAASDRRTEGADEPSSNDRSRRLLADASAAEESARVRTSIILDNGTAVDEAATEARHLGYDVRRADEPVTGSAREAGVRIARDALAIADRLQPGSRPVCLVSGGETTVVVRGSGRGGRNQELALAAAITLNRASRVTVGSVGTDGIDGSSDAAGAVADGESVANAERAAISAGDALENNDSHAFFAAAGGLIRTGPTGTNVMDVQVAVIDPP